MKKHLPTSASLNLGVICLENGFLGNNKVRIPLPKPLDSVERLLLTLGMGRQADELIETMNHAAEAAVAEAGAILMESSRKMSVKTAKDILTGGDVSVSQYFRRTSNDALTTKFKPVVKKATQKVQLWRKYNNIAGKAASAGLIDQKRADLNSYVTQKSLDGPFAMTAEQEKSLRSNPLGASSSLLKKVFGAL